MSYLIALDDGHGMETSGKRTPMIPEIGRFIHENEFNRAVVKQLDIELSRCGFRTLLVAPTDADTPLKQRTDLANVSNADAYVSIHFDASDSKFDGDGKDPEGHTIYVWTGQRSKDSGRLAECVLKYLNQGTPQVNRGIKEADFHVLRETHMIAILSENGFMDNKREALLMIDPKFVKEVAVEHAKGLCEYFKVTYVEEVIPTPVTPPTPQPKAVYRVRKSWTDVASQIGAFSDLDNAIDCAKKNVGYNVYDESGKQVYPTAQPNQPVQPPKPEPKPEPKPQPVVPKKKYLVLPATEDSWRVYPLNKSPKKGNECGYLNPKKFHGLEYEVLGNPQTDIYIIQTQTFGKVQIYGASSTGAKIVLK